MLNYERMRVKKFLFSMYVWSENLTFPENVCYTQTNVLNCKKNKLIPNILSVTLQHIAAHVTGFVICFSGICSLCNGKSVMLCCGHHGMHPNDHLFPRRRVEGVGDRKKLPRFCLWPFLSLEKGVACRFGSIGVPKRILISA